MLIEEKVREFLEQPRMCVMATINRDGSPQLTAMWYDLDGDVVILNTQRGLLKERNLRRDPRMAIRYVGLRLGSVRWQVIAGSDRLGIHLQVDRVVARGFD